jgi:hypothetical protein
LVTSDTWSLQEQVADKIATQLAGAYGAIARVAADRLARKAPPNAETYEWIIRVRAYRRHFTAPGHAEVRAGLEHVLKRNPSCADAWACLAMVYVDEHRFGFNRRAEPPEPLVRALAAAQRSLALAGHSAVARIGLSLVYHHLYRHEESCALAREAMALNPNSPEIVGQAAARLACVDFGMKQHRSSNGRLKSILIIPQSIIFCSPSRHIAGTTRKPRSPRPDGLPCRGLQGHLAYSRRSVAILDSSKRPLLRSMRPARTAAD